MRYQNKDVYVAAAYVDLDLPAEILRGAWIPESRHCQQLCSQDGICHLLDGLTELGFNAVFPAVWNRGYTAFRSRTMERHGFPAQDPRYTSAGLFDPLDIIVNEANKRQLLVVPWLEYGFCSPQVNLEGNHITESRPDWCSQDRNGRIVQDDYVLWLNSLHEDVQQFLLDIALEVIHGYAVHGIQGDDHWPAMQKLAGYDPVTRQAYRQDTGQDPPLDPEDTDWTTWRVNQITADLKRVVQAVKEAKSTALIGMGSSVFSDEKGLLMPDGESWIRAGLVDLFHPQIHRPSAGSYRRELQGAIAGWPVEWRRILAPGIHLRPNGAWMMPNDLGAMIQANRADGLAGEVIFTGALLQEPGCTLSEALLKDADYAVAAVLPAELRALVA